MAVWRCLHALRGRAQVACSLAGPEVAVRTFEFPALPRHQLASAVELEAAQVCPFEVSEATVSYHVLQAPSAKGAKPPDGQRIRGFFAAAETRSFSSDRSLCERGDTSCVLMDVDGLALLNCLEACKQLQGGRGRHGPQRRIHLHERGDRLRGRSAVRSGHQLCVRSHSHAGLADRSRRPSGGGRRRWRDRGIGDRRSPGRGSSRQSARRARGWPTASPRRSATTGPARAARRWTGCTCAAGSPRAGPSPRP